MSLQLGEGWAKAKQRTSSTDETAEEGMMNA
jgi:hypothetical protein